MFEIPLIVLGLNVYSRLNSRTNHSICACNFSGDVEGLLCNSTSILKKYLLLVASGCSDYHYCITLFKKVLTQVLRRFKSCARRVRDSRWWGSLTMVPARNKAEPLSLVSHTTKAFYHHHHYYYHHHHHHHQNFV